MADPSRLWASAQRIYGEDMARLWGSMDPVPERNLKVLGDDEMRKGPWRVAYTPGHASHHVAYLHEPSGSAFAGDVAGVRIPPDGFVLPPTPPPDIDVAAWHRSIDLIAGWDPATVAVTHFGRYDDVQRQLTDLHAMLDRMADAAHERDHAGFTAWIESEIRANTSDAATDSFLQATPPQTLYAGMERALRRVGSEGA
jgi:glyoxylase-like metal-dependent hydrolase (beta-lactamase superfamily II)